MNNVTINGQVIDGDLVAGKTINISSDGDKIIINGKTVLTTQEKNITVVVHGNVSGDVITTSGDVNVYGTACNDVRTMSGGVHIEKEVLGNVKTMSGNVSAGSIGGNTSTMSGDIRTR